jgi:hypothetical protein
MGTELLSELTRENTAHLRRVTAAVDAEARRLEELERAPAELAHIRRRAARAAREATRQAIAGAAEVERLWRGVLACLNEGLEKGVAAALVTSAAGSFEPLHELVTEVWGLWATAGRAGAVPEGIDELNTVTRKVEELRATAERMRVFLATPRPAVDPALLADAVQAVADGRVQSPEAVRAGLADRPG